MANVTVLVAARTDVGRVRTNNEDALLMLDLARGTPIAPGRADQRLELGDEGLLLALSDGMGGHEAGEVASAQVLEELGGALKTTGDHPVAAALDNAVKTANEAVFQAAVASHKKGMGATLTALLVRGAEVHLAQVGDSRAYLLRSGRMVQISRDQSMVQLLIEAGAISPEEAQHSPQKNLILQAMGFAADVKVAIGRLELRRDDLFLLCCDGLSNALSAQELGDVLASSEPAEACKRLIDLANERGGQDNLTAIVARFSGSDLQAAGPDAPAIEVLQDPTRAGATTRGAQPHATGRPPAAEPPPRAPPSVPADASRPSEDRESSSALLLVAILLVVAIAALAVWSYTS